MFVCLNIQYFQIKNNFRQIIIIIIKPQILLIFPSPIGFVVIIIRLKYISCSCSSVGRATGLCPAGRGFNPHREQKILIQRVENSFFKIQINYINSTNVKSVICIICLDITFSFYIDDGS